MKLLVGLGMFEINCALSPDGLGGYVLKELDMLVLVGLRVLKLVCAFSLVCLGGRVLAALRACLPPRAVANAKQLRCARRQARAANIIVNVNIAAVVNLTTKRAVSPTPARYRKEAP